MKPITTQQDQPHKNTEFPQTPHTPGHTSGVLVVVGVDRVVQFSDMCGSLVSPTILTSTMASSAAWQEVLTEMLITNNFLPVGFPSRHTHFSYFAEFEVFIIISKFHVISFA